SCHRSGRLDVLVAFEQVGRVSLALDGRETPVLLLAVGRAYAVLALMADVVQIDPAAGIRGDVATERLDPLDVLVAVGGSSHIANGCMIHDAFRLVIGVASSPTRATAPPHGISTGWVNGEYRSNPYFTNTSRASPGRSSRYSADQ